MSTARYRIIFAALALIMLLAQAAAAADQAQSAATPDNPSRSLLSLTAEQALQLKPMEREIRDVLLRERNDLAALTSLLKGQPDNLEALRIQKDVSTRKQQTEIAILEVQARYAVQAGRQEQATAIGKAVALLKERLAQPVAETEVTE